MWPEILKSLRNGLVFNPLTELQKRATQFGEDVGTDLQAKRAQANYAVAHPKSQRAQLQRMANAATLALQTWKPIEGVSPEHLAKIDKNAPESIIAPAMANKKTGLFNTGTAHFEAVPNLIRALVKGSGGEPDTHGWLTSHGRIVSDAQAYKIKNGSEGKLRSEDFNAALDSVSKHLRFPGDAPGVVDRIGPKGIWSKWLQPEKTGVESPPISGKFLSPEGKMAGYIIPENPDAAFKLGLRNRVSAEVEATKPSKPGLSLLDSLATAGTRGAGRALSAEDKRMSEFRQIDSAWNISKTAWQALAEKAAAEPNTRRTELANALRGGPKPPTGTPELMGHYHLPDYIPTVEAVKYAKRLPQQFKQAVAASQRVGNTFYGSPGGHRTERSKAIDIEIAARRVVRQAQSGVFVPPHATPAEAATIIGHGEQVARGLHKINPDIWTALVKAMNAARFIHLKD